MDLRIRLQLRSRRASSLVSKYKRDLGKKNKKIAFLNIQHQWKEVIKTGTIVQHRQVRIILPALRVVRKSALRQEAKYVKAEIHHCVVVQFKLHIRQRKKFYGIRRERFEVRQLRLSLLFLRGRIIRVQTSYLHWTMPSFKVFNHRLALLILHAHLQTLREFPKILAFRISVRLQQNFMKLCVRVKK